MGALPPFETPETKVSGWSSFEVAASTLDLTTAADCLPFEQCGAAAGRRLAEWRNLTSVEVDSVASATTRQAFAHFLLEKSIT
jgi:hypothetical protein